MTKDNGKFSLAMFLCAANMATFAPYLLPYLTSLGYSYSTISFMLLVYNLGIVASFPIIGYLNDNYISMKKSLIGLGIICALSTTTFIFTNKSTLVIYVFLLMMSLCQKPLFAVLETYVTKMATIFDFIDFGLTRSFASLGFALTSLLMGFLIEQFGYSFMYVAQLIFFIVFLLSVTTLKNFPQETVSKDDVIENKVTFISASLALMKNNSYILIVIIASFMTIPLAGFNSYLPVYIKAVNGNSENLGIALFIMAISEIPIFVGYKKFNKRIDENYLLLLACFTNVLKLLLPTIFQSMIAIYISQAMQCIAFGLFVPSVYVAISKCVKTERLSYAMSIAITFYSSIIGTLSIFLSGIALDSISIFTLLKFYAFCAFIALMFTVIRIKKFK